MDELLVYNETVKEECDHLPRQELRQEPTGWDLKGNIFWTQVRHYVTISYHNLKLKDRKISTYLLKKTKKETHFKDGYPRYIESS